MKGLMRKLSKDMKASKEIIVCVEEKDGKETLTLKRSISLESLTKILSKSQESLKAGKEKKPQVEPKRKLSGLSLRIRKMSAQTELTRRGRISSNNDGSQTELRRGRNSSFVEGRQRKVSIQPDFNIGNVVIPAEKRVRKGSLQPNMLTMGRRNSTLLKKDPKARKMSVPANMKFSTERVRVRRVSFVNQNTGETFQMNKK
ncbi:uncharacterized protein [Clytia hemisphaerica]|uniref:Uncharacterized protein n=1 Tax=Clytia hemisphaerica TaxID=252671 RepID=A0A7M5V772_9CNID|eukprot:TCONS_00004408-protein